MKTSDKKRIMETHGAFGEMKIKAAWSYTSVPFEVKECGSIYINLPQHGAEPERFFWIQNHDGWNLYTRFADGFVRKLLSMNDIKIVWARTKSESIAA